MEKGKSVNVILIILLLVLLCVACGFGYMWYKNKNVSCPKCESTNEANINSEVSVIDATSISPQYFGLSSTDKIKITLPKIIGGKVNAETLNKEILDEVMNKSVVILGYSTNENTDLNVSYKSLIKNDIVYILIIVKTNSLNNTLTSFYYNYFYDIKNDKIITATESLDKNGYTDEKYLNEFTKCHGEDFEEVKCTLEHIKNTINDKDNCTYIDIDNNNLKVHFEDFCN